jgi:hypothetical protein
MLHMTRKEVEREGPAQTLTISIGGNKTSKPVNMLDQEGFGISLDRVASHKAFTQCDIEP